MKKSKYYPLFFTLGTIASFCFQVHWALGVSVCAIAILCHFIIDL